MWQVYRPIFPAQFGDLFVFPGFPKDLSSLSSACTWLIVRHVSWLFCPIRMDILPMLTPPKNSELPSDGSIWIEKANEKTTEIFATWKWLSRNETPSISFSMKNTHQQQADWLKADGKTTRSMFTYQQKPFVYVWWWFYTKCNASNCTQYARRWYCMFCMISISPTVYSQRNPFWHSFGRNQSWIGLATMLSWGVNLLNRQFSCQLEVVLPESPTASFT